MDPFTYYKEGGLGEKMVAIVFPNIFRFAREHNSTTWNGQRCRAETRQRSNILIIPVGYCEYV